MPHLSRPSSAIERARCAAIVALGLTLSAPQAGAQAWFYPSFQIPTIVNRDYNFGVAGGGGTAFVFQWREGLDARNQLSLDAGLVDPSGVSNTKLLVGGQFARQLTRATNEQPLDLLLTIGTGVSVGDGRDIIRVPVGVSVGHRFPLDGELAITPYVHPRVSLDVLTGADGETARTHLTLDFDLGGSLELTRTLAIRGSVIFSGGEGAASSGVGVGLTYTPSMLRKP